MQLAPGTLVDHYRVQRLVGSGAMGEVYLSIDEGLGRRAALKILSDQHRDNPELRARFVREARAVASIAHPNVVQVFATGEHDKRPYLAMEFLDGRDLGSLVKETGPLDSVAVCEILIAAARGLDAAARAGLIHRDVKPSNLMRLADGTIKVTDFGLAKPIEGDPSSQLTALGIVVGTPDYIAPEQARGETLDAKVDVYALGGTMFFLLTGRPPFRKGDDVEDRYIKVVARHLKDPPPDPRADQPGVDAELVQLIKRMMAKSPGERPTYDEVVRVAQGIHGRLVLGRSTPATAATKEVSSQEALGARMASVQPRAKTPVPVPSSSDAELSSSVPLPTPRRSTWLVVVTVISVLIFLGGLGLLLFGPRAPAAAAPASSGPVDAARPDAAPPDAALPTPPAGMLLVRVAGRSFFVDRVAVSNEQYKHVHTKHKIPPGAAAKPVLNASYANAQAYATAQGKRLLRADEWEAALGTPGFAPAGMTLWEWVDDGDATVPAPKNTRAVRRQDKTDRRPARGAPDVTFRLARDL